jgi:cardiolipin synthase
MPTSHSDVSTSDGHSLQWHDSGAGFLRAELEAIDRAASRVLLEHYIFRPSPIAERFRDALVRAARRGVQVTVLLDYVGCISLPKTYFHELTELGGRVIWFNPVRWRLWLFRDHRKLLIADEQAFLGGCNIAPEYDGDGIHHGWRDGGLAVTGPVVEPLVQSYGSQVEKAGAHKWWQRRHGHTGWVRSGDDVSLLLTRPGFRQNALQGALRSDLLHADHVAITMAYFLPVGRVKRMLLRAAKVARSFRLILPGKSDVPAMQIATRALYGAFQRAGAEIFEYQPQVLHAKIIVVDDIVYIGSANLDPRSLSINFELMLRIRSAELAAQAMATFQRDLAQSVEVPRRSWRQRSGWWEGLKQKMARLVFTRLDLGVAQIFAQKAERHGLTHGSRRPLS